MQVEISTVHTYSICFGDLEGTLVAATCCICPFTITINMIDFISHQRFGEASSTGSVALRRNTPPPPL